MHSLFADWHRSVDLEPVLDTLSTHWNVAVELAEDSDLAEATGLAALFLRTPGNAEARERLQTTAKEADPTFPVRDNDAIIGVIAGAALMHLMGLDIALGDAGSLAVVCGHAHGTGPTGPLPDVLNEAKKTLDRRARELRSIATPPAKRPSRPTFADPVAKMQPLSEVSAQNWGAAWLSTQEQDAALRQALSSVNDNVGKAYDSLHRRILALERASGGNALVTLNEETSLLWWLFAEYSNDLDIPLRGLDRGVRALIVGKEVADRTRFGLSHPASRAFLDRALGPADSAAPLGLLETTRSASRDWVEKWVPDIPNLPLGLIPAHVAAWCGSQFGPEEQARQFAQRTGLSRDLQMTALDLAEQVLHEALLIRAIA